ncbi:MAG: alpha/beta fold hydrolase [Myxococcota bacterium]
MWLLTVLGCFGFLIGEEFEAWDSGGWRDRIRPPIAEARLEPWQPCDVTPVSGDGGAQCTRAKLPLDHNDPNGRSIIAALKRIAPPGTSTGQLWVVTGGPGASAIDDLGALPITALALEQGLTVYAVDHRGVGGTSRLNCGESEPQNEAAWADCAATIQDEWGAALAYMTISQSARDLAALTNTLANEKPLWLYGVSYGTMLLDRYVDYLPERAVQIILEAPTSLADRPLNDVDLGTDFIARQVLALCDADQDCADRFADEPEVVADAALSSLDTGRCAALDMTTAEAGQLLGQMLRRAETRDLIPAAVFRLDRCTAQDIARLQHLNAQVPRVLGQLPITEGNTGQGASVAAFHHFAHAELWEPKPETSPPISMGINAQLAQSASAWPGYPLEREDWLFEYHEWPDSPTLLLTGALDPLGGVIYAWDHDNVMHIEMSTGAHQLIGGTPFASGSRDCARELVSEFLRTGALPNASECASNLDPLNFAGDPTVSERYFGTPDAWDD